MTAPGATSRLTTQNVVKVFIVDDHPIVRQGLRQLLSQEEDMVVCGEAEGMSQAMQLYFEKKPQVMLVDISLENGNGIELVKELMAHDRELKILVCSMHDESLYAERALRAGAMGYINKEMATDRLIEAVRRVAAGQIFLSEEMTHRFLARQIGQGEVAPPSPMESLSDRELEVFELIGHGMKTRQIAERLHLSPKTVETYRENIKRKMNLANSVELTQHAVQWVLEKT